MFKRAMRAVENQMKINAGRQRPHLCPQKSNANFKLPAMSILQIEIPDETRAQIEAHARSEGQDAASWLLSLAEKELRQGEEDEPEVGEEERQYIRGELLRALESPMIEVTPEWWEQFTKETMARIDAEHSK